MTSSTSPLFSDNICRILNYKIFTKRKKICHGRLFVSDPMEMVSRVLKNG